MWPCVAFVLLLIAASDASDFRCDYKYSEDADGYLKLHRIPAEWKDARLRCHLEGAKLASPLTPALMTEMLSMMDVKPKLKRGVFLGLQAIFSKGDYVSAEGVPLSQIPHTWAEGEPDNHNNNETCLLMTDGGEFTDVNCADTYPYICYKKNSSVLPVNECGTSDEEYHLSELTGSCYKLHTTPRPWSRAYMTCQAEGGYLAIINNDTEAEILTDLLQELPSREIPGNFYKDVAIVGIQDWGEHGEFLTIHGDTLAQAGYDTFSKDEPSDNLVSQFCVGLERNGMFADIYCTVPLMFICEKDPQSLTCNNNIIK